MDAERRCLIEDDDGQSLIEVAIMLPLFTLLICYAIDYGYYFVAAASLSSAARIAVEYSIQGFSSPLQATEPAAGPITSSASVAGLAAADLGLVNASTLTTVEVCSNSVGVSAGNVTQCASYGASSINNSPDADPEPTFFQLNRVEVVYTVQPPIPITFPSLLGFSSVSLVAPATFHRFAEMRALGG